MFTQVMIAVAMYAVTLTAAGQSCSESASAVYEQGLTAMAEGRVDAAINDFANASKACDNARYSQALGDAYRARIASRAAVDSGEGEPEFAAPALEAYGKAFATARRDKDEKAGAQAARSIAELGLLTGDPLKSQNWLLVANRLDPEHPDMPDLQARLDAARGQLSAEEIETGLSQTRGIGRVKNLLGGGVTSNAFWDPDDSTAGGGSPSRDYLAASTETAENEDQQASINIPIRFYSNSTKLTTETASNVKNLAKVLVTKSPSTRVIISGHADVRGDEDYNLALSQARAETIRSLLEEEAPTLDGRIAAKGYGESQPVDDGNSERSHANNRRIEVTVIESDSRTD